MRHVKLFCSVSCVTALLAGAVVSAQVADRTTQVTFNTAVELPGKTLPAGTYTFRLATPQGERNVIHVLDAKGEKHEATLFSMPARRVERAEDTVITFHELPADTTPAIRFWYYPGDPMGHEFAYPKDRALAIATATNVAVLSVEDETITRVEPAPSAPAVADTPTPPADERVETTPPAPEMAAVGTSGRRLPRTASQLPLAGLIGLASLGAGLAMRRFRMTRG